MFCGSATQHVASVTWLYQAVSDARSRTVEGLPDVRQGKREIKDSGVPAAAD